MHSNHGSTTSSQALKHVFAVGLLLIGGWAATSTPLAWGQVITRKAKTKVTPTYPEMARHLNIAGVVKVQVTVSANGSVKEAKPVGGHPVLVSAALEAAKQWRFEAGPEETTETVAFHFDPTK